MYPDDLKYTKTHEWARIEDGVATLGITDHAQSELGDVVFAELPQIGTKIKSGDVFGTVESVKTVSDLITPVSGEVVKVNEALPDTPELINDSPYSSGWLISVKMDNPSDVENLMTAQDYESYIQEH